ncbi:MAG: MFS transporter [Spirochaetales bacterium]|nr:MFS transporter [Spirochaetales bacterium]
MNDNRKVALFGFIYLGLFGSFAVISPFLQLFLRGLDFSPSQIGLMLGSFEIAGIFGPMIIGAAGDRTGKFKILLFTCEILAIIFHSSLLLDLPFILSLGSIFFLGFFFKNGIPLTETLASHGLPDFQKNYGKVRVVGSLSYVGVAFFLSVFKLIDATSPQSILFWFVTMVLFHISTLFFLPKAEYTPEAHSKREGSLSLIFWLGIATVFFNRLSMSAYYSFFFLFIQETWNIQQIGAVSALSAFAEIPVIIYAIRFIPRYGYPRLFTIALLGTTARMMLNAFAPNFGLVLAGQVLHCLSFGLMHAVIIAFIQEKTKPANRGIAMAIYISLGMGMGGFLGSTMGGYIVEQSGFRMLYFIYGLIPLGGLIPCWFLKRRLAS